MNKRIIVGAFIVLFIVAGVSLWSKDSKNDSLESADVVQKDGDKIMKEGDDTSSMATDETSVMMKNGTYEAYAPEKLSKAETGKVIIFFRAGWCPTCRTLDADIKANIKNIPEHVTILDLDYDNSTALKKKYGVTYQHTLVQVDKDGNLIKKWMGSPNLSAFIKEII